MLDVRSLSAEQDGVDFSPASAGSINRVDIFSIKLIKEKI